MSDIKPDHYKTIRKLAFRLVILIGILCAIFIGVLKLITRSPDQLEQGFESYLTQAAGYPADIGKLSNVQFFPDLWFDMKDIRFWSIEAPDDYDVLIKHAELRMPLWAALVGSPRFSALSLDEMVFEPVVTDSERLSVDYIALNHQQESLNVSARMADAHLTASLPVKKAGKREYYVPNAPFRLEGELKSGKTRGHFFIDVTSQSYGITASFETFAPADIQVILPMAEKLLRNRKKGPFPVRIDIQSLGDQGGPYVFEQVWLDKDGLQPFRCLLKSEEKARGGEPHPCAKVK